MLATLLRIITVFVVNAVFIYILSIAAFLLASAIAGSDPREAGLTMISPLAFVVFGMIFIAAIGSLLNGILINALWSRFVEEINQTVKFNAIIGASVTLLIFVGIFGPPGASATRPSPSDILKIFALYLVASGIFALGNVLTVLTAKRLFHRENMD